MVLNRATHHILASLMAPEQPANKLQCSTTRMNTGVTLRGGLKSGNFTDVGEVENMSTCVKLCCVAEKCDVALMINNNCFMVSCQSVSACEMVRSLTTEYHPSLAYVKRKKEILRKNGNFECLWTYANFFLKADRFLLKSVIIYTENSQGSTVNAQSYKL